MINPISNAVIDGFIITSRDVSMSTQRKAQSYKKRPS